MTRPAPSFIDACAGAVARAPPPAGPSATTADDWDALFRAVRTRLQQSADAPAGQAQVIVEECVQALDQLHAMLAVERGPSGGPSFRSRVIERFIKPWMPRVRDARVHDLLSMRGRVRPRPRLL